MMRNGGNCFVAVQIKKKKRNWWKYQLKQQLIKTIIVDKDDNKKDDNKKDDHDEDNGDDEGKVEFFVRVGKNKRFKYY